MVNQKEYYLTREVITVLHQSITERNLRKIPKMELIESVKDRKAREFLKKKREGIETCYHGFFNHSEIIVCTTDSDYIDDLKKDDLGWVLLLDPNSSEPFYSFPIRRTKNFCTTMLGWIDCMIDIATKWPTLPGTNLALRLVRVTEMMHMRQFIPPKGSAKFPHRKPYYFWIAELELDERNSKFLIDKFKRFYQYRRKDDKERIDAGEQPREFARVIRYEKKNGAQPKQGIHHVKEYIDVIPNYDVFQ